MLSAHQMFEIFFPGGEEVIDKQVASMKHCCRDVKMVRDSVEYHPPCVVTGYMWMKK